MFYKIIVLKNVMSVFFKLKVKIHRNFERKRAKNKCKTKRTNSRRRTEI